MDELDQAIKTVGLPCIVKPVMSSSGKGQTLIKTQEEDPLAWENATKNMRGDRVKVIVEEFINFISEITLLTIRQSNSSTYFVLLLDISRNKEIILKVGSLKI